MTAKAIFGGSTRGAALTSVLTGSSIRQCLPVILKVRGARFAVLFDFLGLE
jgi:hypothetical protein